MNGTRLKTALFFMAVVMCLPLAGETTFSSLDLNSGNRLLYAAEINTRNNVSYKNLCLVNLTSNLTQAAAGDSQLLTCFPEKVDVFLGGSRFQFRNEDGVAEYSMNDGKLSWVSGSSAGNMAASSVSPDGNWICRFEKKSPALADLVLEQVSTGKTMLLASDAEFSYSSVPVRWSPDSQRLIYEKEGQLLFLETSEAFNSELISEEYRVIGKGSVGNVYWASSSLLAYVYRDTVYKIYTNEFYTRALYADLMGSGTIAGRLPKVFDRNKDAFWTNSDATSIVLVQDNYTLWYMELEGRYFNIITTMYEYPFERVPEKKITFDVYWTSDGSGIQIPVIWVEQKQGEKSISCVYKLAVDRDVTRSVSFKSMQLPSSVTDPQLSPDGRRLCFRGGKSLYIYSLSSWQQDYVFSEEDIISFRWINRTSILVGGKETVRIWEPEEYLSYVLFLSSAETFSWETDNKGIVASNSSGSYRYNEATNTWNASSVKSLRKAQTQNGYYRVFTGNSFNSEYTNAIYVRSLTGLYSTSPLFKNQVEKEPFKPSVALVVDAMDSADGIASILETLDRYGLKVTFFINGEFLRRFPTAVTEIVDAGHECASMFFTSAELVSSSFISDESFIRRGLARNEDEFLSLTGKELTLYWHAPYYKADSSLRKSGLNAGYTYVENSTPIYDTTTLEGAVEEKKTYYSTSEIIDLLCMSLYDGAVIPVSSGLNEGTRSDYLYDRFDVLIEAILDAGYRIVPVSDVR